MSAATLSLTLLAGRESAAMPIEPFVSAGILAPATSPYRGAAGQLGYERGDTKINFDAELGALFAIAFDNRLWIGPQLRFDIGRMGAPYGGIDPIRTDAASFAVREELQLFRWPKVLLWVDESLGLGRIGTSAAHTTVPFWGVRFGLALRIGNQRPAVRLRFGYAIAPTFSSVAAAGRYDFGGFLFAIA
ncbi:MAG: hypothetical protein ABI175_27725, partial [Polyangiales bacterium]